MSERLSNEDLERIAGMQEIKGLEPLDPVKVILVNMLRREMVLMAKELLELRGAS